MITTTETAIATETAAEEVDSPANEARELAEEILGRLRAAIAGRRAVLAENMEVSKRLAEMRADITQRESALDPESLPDVRDLTARKEQERLLAIKLTDDCASELRLADAALVNAAEDAAVSEFFASEGARLVEQVTSALRPFTESVQSAMRVLPQIDAPRIFQRHANYWPNSVVDPASAAKLAAFFEDVVAGRAPWVFPAAPNTEPE